MRTCLVAFLVTVLCFADSAWAARRSLKKRIETPTQWYGSADISYSNWIKDRLEGGGESQAAGFQLGLTLPRSVATYIRFSYMPDPVGILDLRAGISKSISFGNSFRNSWSSSLSAPTSEYSRSIYQITQASLASTLEYSRGNSTLSFTAYGTKAYYSREPEVYEYSTELWLGKKAKHKQKVKKARPPAMSPLTTLDLNPAETFSGGEIVELDFTDVIYLARFDYLTGGAIDLSYRINSEWTINTAGSLTRSTFTADEPIWSADVTVFQASWSRKSLSIFAGFGFVDSGLVPRMPGYRNYNAGTSYFFSN